MKLNHLTIIQALEGLRKREFSSVELVTACLEQIKKNKDLNAFITVCKKEALAEAQKADNLASQGEALQTKPLLGIPIALKDNYSTKGIQTTAGSNVLKGYIPPFDATVVKKLKDAGAIIIGKTNMDAWAHGSSGENSDFGPTKNPYNKEYVPGGSGSGSAVAVASDMCLAATGTDTGGSVRLPASFTNTVGFKPTYGRVSRYGIVAMGSSLDSIGHITKTVEDSKLLLSITEGKDPLDATTFEKNHDMKPLKRINIGVVTEFLEKGLDPKIRELFDKAKQVITDITQAEDKVKLPSTDYGIAAYYIIQPAEVSSNLARYDGIRFGSGRQNFGEEAKRRIMLGTYTLSAGYYDAYYKKAMQVRTLVKQDFDAAFKNVDAIIAPVSPTLPWKIGEKVDDPLKMYLSDVFTVTVNLAGIPGLSIPIGFANGLPVGMQILGPQFSEETLFQIGYAYENATASDEWRKQKPIF